MSSHSTVYYSGACLQVRLCLLVILLSAILLLLILPCPLVVLLSSGGTVFYIDTMSSGSSVLW